VSERGLERFVDAQDRGGTYDRALAELRRGRKESHWMWFVFPQIAGLGSSEMARTYAIADLDEAKRYLRHPVLGTRLRECVDALGAARGKSATEILGGIDAMKLRSSLTLFARAAPEESAFTELLERFFAGIADDATDERLRA
jgi:uncharacterized protein (DUF1810 family)